MMKHAIEILIQVVAFAAVAQPFPIPTTQPTTRPLAVYRQPAASAQKWHDRGITVAFGYESNGGTVAMTQWETAWTSLGCKVIREPGAVQNVDAADDNLLAVLNVVTINGKQYDELDNLVVSVRDSGGNPETVYVTAEQNWTKWHNVKPVVILVGLEQLRWKLPNGKPKVDYARLGRACSYFAVDYYPVQRGLPLSDYPMLIDQLSATSTGGKPKLGFLECSNQHLNPLYYPHCRAPTPAEWNTEIKSLTDRQMTPGEFPQQIGEDGAGFLYDAVPDNLLAAQKLWSFQPTNAVGPLDGKTIWIEGYWYWLRSN